MSPAVPKPHPVSDPVYRAWVATHRCVACQARPDYDPPRTEYDRRVQAAHVHSRGSGGDDRENVVPLCIHHHYGSSKSLHLLHIRVFDITWGIHLEVIAKMLWHEYHDAPFAP